MNWLYKGEEVPTTTPNKDNYGFVYRLILNDGTFYIGKKVIWSLRKKPLTIKEIKALDNKRLKKWKYVTSESDWRSYTSSSKVFGSKDVIKKEILQIARSKRQLTYLETKYLFLHNAIEDENYHNVNILNRFYRNNLV